MTAIRGAQLSTVLLLLLASTDQVPAAETTAQAIKAIQALGGKVTRDANKPGQPVVGVDLEGSEAEDADLAHLKAFPQLQRLNLMGLTSGMPG
jgi:hypothetical protein